LPGDAGVKIKNIALPPGQRNVTMMGTCPATQTAGLPYPLTVFAQAHHMHYLGSSIQIERVRRTQRESERHTERMQRSLYIHTHTGTSQGEDTHRHRREGTQSVWCEDEGARAHAAVLPRRTDLVAGGCGAVCRFMAAQGASR
jgi:hypothetical protein